MEERSGISYVAQAAHLERKKGDKEKGRYLQCAEDDSEFYLLLKGPET
jgi:hypothetical protein